MTEHENNPLVRGGQDRDSWSVTRDASLTVAIAYAFAALVVLCVAAICWGGT